MVGKMIYLWVLSQLVLLSCAGGESLQPHDDNKLEALAVNRSEIVLEVGEYCSLDVAPLPSSADLEKLTWSTGDPSVATVSGGFVRAVGEGKTVISLTCGEISKQIPVRVFDDKVAGAALLYSSKLDYDHQPGEMLVGRAGSYMDDGLKLASNGEEILLLNMYALGQRMVRYRIKASADALINFKSKSGDFSAWLDIPGKCIRFQTNPIVSQNADFLTGEKEYMVDIVHSYREQQMRVTDLLSGETVSLSASNDGRGGTGKGVTNATPFMVGTQKDHYCVRFPKGTYCYIKKISVYCLKEYVKMLIYGDSITQPEDYYPAKDFDESYTQLIISGMKGNAMSSSRSGAQLPDVMQFLPNEVPILKPEFVMITIGTNGGLTAENLSAMIEFILAQGCTPILNNIPCNERGTQISTNQLIESIRQKYGLKGCKFDLATSLAGDGMEVDKSLMFWEDYEGDPYYNGIQVWHHPNALGGRRMYERALIDLPELFQ